MSEHGSRAFRTNRRAFLVGSAAVAGSLVVGFGHTASPRAQDGTPRFAPDQFIRIGSDGKVTLVVSNAEMGQGVLTGVAMLVAEELEVDPTSIAVEQARGDDLLYANPLLGAQITGGSASIRGGWQQMRTAGAAAREMLIAAAAESWSVDPASCRAESGRVLHAASGRSAGYGQLVAAAARQPIPQDPPLRRSDWRVIGKPVPRLDSPAKVDGSARYGIDVRLPGLRYAAIQLCPVVGGHLASIDDAPALAVKGVSQVVRLEAAVAVVAGDTWTALRGLAMLEPQWTGGQPDASTESMIALLDAALETEGLPAVSTGDAAQAFLQAPDQLEAVYRLPMLAHAAMEPLNCTVHVQDDFCELWVGSQVPGRARIAAAETLGLPPEKVRVNNLLLGGGFGRRLEHDTIPLAVAVARQVDGPVKVVWSREEDIRHDAYRAHNHSRVRVGIDAAGLPASWDHRVVGPAVMERFLPILMRDGVDLDAVENAAPPYAIPNVSVDFVRHEPPEGLLVGNWRGVGSTRNIMVCEGVIDELAHRAGSDPVAYRRGLLDPASRLLPVLDRVAADSGWDTPLPVGSGRGVALCEAFGSYIGMVAEVSTDSAGRIRVTRIACAFDCGVAVNPLLVEQQLESGIVYGLSAVLYGRITMRDGRIVESNFHDYPVLRMNQMPALTIALIDGGGDPGGVGEPATTVVAPAVLNAIFAATGERLRSLPLDPAKVQIL